MSGTPVRYVVDAQASRFTARAFAGGPLSAMGHNPTFAIRDLHGEVEYEISRADWISANSNVHRFDG